jgi:L-alanine-DL-glutamate epimerase-like enolase superfamily enzyme
LSVQKGHVAIPERPGLGMEWDEKAVERFAL